MDLIIKPQNGTEQNTLNQFKDTLGKDAMNLSDEMLLRFLRAREQNIPKAEEMLRKALAWRTEKKVSSYLLWTPPKWLKEDFICRWTGKDKDGRPVFWMPMGRYNARVWVEDGQKEVLVQWVYHILESITQQAILEMKSSQITFIYGMEELTFWKVANIDVLKVLYGAFQDLEQNYPEVINSIYVVNAPWAFTIAFNFIKPILSAHTMGKIQVFNSDKKRWMQALLDKMPKESIPQEYLADETIN